MMNAQMCFLGGGNMTKSLVSGLIGDKVDPSSITVIDRNIEKLNALQQQYHIHTTTHFEAAIQAANILLLCVKPQSTDRLLQTIKPLIHAEKRPLFISLAAGIPEQQLSLQLGHQLPIVRAMPNTPAIIGCGATALYANQNVSMQQKEVAEKIMRRVGVVAWVKSEEILNVVTAISGSGPAYFLYMMESLIDSAVQNGLTQEQATLLVTQTAFGTAKMVLKSHENIETLRQNVTSKKGVTAAAMTVFEAQGFHQMIEDAVQTNIIRSEEIARLFEKALTHQG